MKAIDGILGFAIGDAIGVPIEFSDREELLSHPVTKMLSNGNYDVPKGTWSDDTAMTLATVDSLYRMNKIDFNDLMKRFCDWVNKGMYTADGFVFDIGSTTKRSLLKYYQEKENPLKCGGRDICDNGNGSLMRMFPIAYYCYINNMSEKDIEYIAIGTSSLTHAHQLSTLGCYIYITYVKNILDGNDKETSFLMLRDVDYSLYDKSMILKYRRILNTPLKELSIDDINSTGYIIDTLEAVLWVILNTNSYEEAIIASINLGGDTDTIGAITGSIAGILYGKDTIPNKWVSSLRNINFLNRLVSKWEASLKEESVTS